MAKTFTFRFETMLKIRRQREDHHRRIVANRLREIQTIVDQLGALDRQIEETTQLMRFSQAEGTVDIQNIVRSRHWMGHLQRNVLELQASRRGHEAKLAQERAALGEAAKQRRVLEKLKERQRARYLEEMDRREMREADEMSVMRHVYEARTVDEKDIDGGCESVKVSRTRSSV